MLHKVAGNPINELFAKMIGQKFQPFAVFVLYFSVFIQSQNLLSSMMPIDLNDMVDKSPVQNKMLYVIQTRMPHKFNPRFAQL